MFVVEDFYPEQTADDMELGWGDDLPEEDPDAFYLDDKPPHWA